MKALYVAKYILAKCTNDGHPISNLQLQKILYYIQYEFLTKYDEPLFEDDFEAWKFGPVIPSIYYKYCAGGSLKIISNDNADEDFNDLYLNQKYVIDEIVEKQRIKYPWNLVNEVHKKNKAWDKVFSQGAGSGKIIQQKDIKENGF
ncbi:Panacea domain-containing protein [Campylobacter corcagiensis]|uniref:DUF4065 domain-containing protein n=1 Tax=Campylobacter corcagiensis TaxID=1448857 RepID=A0A7M1LH69_9BACT|nr:type II toxin-antitoxin system antitoxin SocA domain-containing protein [Campylobacter corcagiensis]QKF64112.1 DUF4065 domain-containing protein [Campylobacter corcagiensis]QOQ87693.1 DUF4065 domain-containing protein [Campylobacter corcagiensis]